MSWSNQKPPWVCFPNHPECSVLRATQGAEESWITDHWWPFWLGLSAEQRIDYLKYWKAEPEWSDALQFFTELRENYDEEEKAADAAEWERYSAELEEKKQNLPKPWYDGLMFWR